MSMKTPHPIDILLVEDNPGDVEMMRLAFEEAKLANPLHVASDGLQALAYLRREPPFENAGRPQLILLDLNLPGIDGRDVLQEIKSDPRLRRIPVVVLTTSREEADVCRSYDLHASSYIPKPLSVPDLITIMRSFDQYWLSVVRLPSSADEPEAMRMAS